MISRGARTSPVHARVLTRPATILASEPQVRRYGERPAGTETAHVRRHRAGPIAEPNRYLRFQGSVIAIALLVSGCGASHVARDYAPTPGDPDGVVVVSLTRSGIGSQFNLAVGLRALDRRYQRNVTVTDLLTPNDWSCPALGTIPEDPPCGRLAVLRLVPGAYEFFEWSGSTGSATISSRQHFSKTFTVVAATVTYLGNLHLAIGSGGFTPQGGTIVIRLIE